MYCVIYMYMYIYIYIYEVAQAIGVNSKQNSKKIPVLMKLKVQFIRVSMQTPTL